jgi:regulatory protein
MKDVFSLKEAIQKIEYFCSYQERCHDEVVAKLRTMKMDSDEIDQIMAHLIAENFLSEERFACSFARGKHRIKHWGKIRIVNELKFKKISQTLINIALKEITPEEYLETLSESELEIEIEWLKSVGIAKQRGSVVTTIEVSTLQ